MIDSNTQPQQILVIDDNEVWLDRLVRLKMQGLCCRGKTSFDVYQFIQEKVDVLTTIVVNANLISNFGENRCDFLGVDLLNDVLINHFPKMNFILLSFTYTQNAEQQTANYIDFLNLMNQYQNNGSR
jgi:hypothetical protein